MKHFPLFAALLGGMMATSAGSAQSCDCPPINERTEVVVTDAGTGIGTATWTCDNIYLLDGYVFVQAGQMLTVNPGTIVKGMAGSGADAAALIVARDGQIQAEGAADCPITFTFESDPLDGSVAYNTRGQWGGVIILGNATTNLPTAGQVEGIPSENELSTYGGSNDADNSGTLAYVSIRHGGAQLGAANEINGLTLAGVGNGTTIHHIEVISNEDDGIELFGGAVEVNYAAVGFVGDDSFDWDQGWHGSGHHWFAINEPGAGDRGGELDGDDSPDVTADGMPIADPSITNLTFMGQGSSYGKQGMLFRAGSGGHIEDFIIVGFAEGIEVEDMQDPSDAYDKWQTGDLTFMNGAFDDVDTVIDYDGDADAEGDNNLVSYAADQNLTAMGTGIDNVWSANASGTAFTDPFSPWPTEDVSTDGPFGYMGAFGMGDNWLAGWSFMDISGALTMESTNSVASQEATSGIVLFPNPTSVSLNIMSQEVAGYDILSLTGAIEAQGQLAAGLNTLDVAGLPAGIHFVQIITANGQETIRFVKN
jgi:hypothetical protein